MKRHLGRLALLLFGFAVFVLLTGGIALLLGKSHTYTGVVSRVIGAMLVLLCSAVLFATARQWATWFFGLCALAALKAVFALLFGFTFSQPRLVVTNRLLASAILLLLVALVVLSYRFVVRPRRSRLDDLTLTGAVIGVLAAMFTEPNLWPLVAAVGLLAVSWLADHRLAHHGG